MKCRIKSLEYNIIWTCNNCCANCSHMSPVNPPYFVEPGSFARSLALAAKIIEPDEFTLLGGEPLLHPRLIELIHIAKESGISRRVQVTTNGKLLDKQPDEFWRSIDALRVTRYPGQIVQEQWERWKRKSTEFGVYFHGGMNPEFYVPISAYELNGMEMLERYSKCPWKSHCTTLHEGCLYLCPQALFFPKHFSNLADGDDILVLDGATDSDVIRYMNDKNPLRVCKICSYSKYVPWHQTTRENWFKESVDDAICS